MKQFPEELRVSCPRCGMKADLPQDIMEQSYDPEVNVILPCPVCERRFVLRDGRLLPEDRPSLPIRFEIETKNKKTVYEGDLLNETPQTMRQRGRFMKDK